MLKDKKTIEEVIPTIEEFIKDSILVAHNASFDIGFLTHALKHELVNPTIDTLPLSRFLFQDEKSLCCVCFHTCNNDDMFIFDLSVMVRRQYSYTF